MKKHASIENEITFMSFGRKNANAIQGWFVGLMESSMKKTFFKFEEMCFELRSKKGEVSEKLSFRTWKSFSLENLV